MHRAVILVIVAAMCVSAGCGPSQSEYDELKRENEALQAELDELKHGADRLLSTAIAMLDQGRLDEASEAVAELLERHPESDEAKEAPSLASRISDVREERAAAARREQEEREAAQRRAEEQRQREIAAATARMSKNVDEMEGITWYRAQSMSREYKTSVQLYFGVREGKKPWLRFVVRYYGMDWLFIDSYFAVVDGERFDDVYEDFDREVGSSGWVWEWADAQARSSLMPMIRAIISSDKATIRLEGDNHYRDHVVSRREKDAMRDVLTAFEAMGGEVN